MNTVEVVSFSLLGLVLVRDGSCLTVLGLVVAVWVVSITSMIPAWVPARIVSVDSVEDIGLSLLSLVAVSLGSSSFIISLVPAVRVVTMVRVVPGSVPARVVSVNTVEVVSFSLLGLVGIILSFILS